MDERSDIFSLGSVMYEMVAGKSPFDANSTSEILANLLKTEPTPLSLGATDVPPDLERIVWPATESFTGAARNREPCFEIAAALAPDR